MRARRYYQRTGKKITISRSDTARFDKSKVECFNCHKMGHFARKCRSPRNQENMPRNQDSSRKTVNVEETSSKAMIAIDGAGFDWSFMAEEEVPTNMAIMAFLDSEVLNEKTCSNTCLKNYETLNTQYDNLRVEFNKFEFDLATYKRGLASVEEQLVFYKKNKVIFYDKIVVLKRDASFKDSEINALNIQLDKLKKEKKSNQIKINNFKNASKSLDKLIGSQISDNSKKGVGFESYNAVAPPPTGLFAPPTIDLSNSGLEEFQQSEFEGCGVKVNKSVTENSSNEIKKTSDAPIIEDWVSNCDEDESEIRVVKSDNVQHRPDRRNFAPTAVLTKSGLVPINTARQSSLGAAVPISTARPINTVAPKPFVNGNPQVALKDTWIFDSGCSKHMTGNKSYLTDYQDYDGGFVAFASSSKEGKITGKCKIRTRKLDFEDVYFVKELKFNLFSVSQMYDKKKNVLFTESECLILSPKFKLPDESHVMLKFPRKDNMYSFDLKNVVPSKGITCLFAKVTNDESKMWHRRLGHINFKTINKLVKRNLVRGLPSKIFPNDHTCVACQKGKQHKATCKSKLMNSFCGIKGIKREFSNARTPQQNGVAERKNRTLIEAARTMLADSLLPITFWAEAADEGFLVGYSINSKAFKVFNSRTSKVEENLHVNFLENKPNDAGIGLEWLFDIYSLTNSMNYQPVSAGNRTNGYAGL
ncbi:ribonuclease H-like domain-containing protein [Tanacetum coccineum]